MQISGSRLLGRRAILGAALASLAMTMGGTNLVLGQENFPDHPVKIVVAYPPGASTDIMARLLADSLSRVSGADFIVENREGAGGQIGIEYVTRAKADGYTLLFNASGSLVITPAVRSDMPFDVLEDLQAVALISSYSQIFVAPAAMNVSTLAEFVEKVKADGSGNYASSGVGSTQHLAGATLAQLAGLDMEHIPYSGTGPAILDVAAGRVSLGMGTNTSIQPHIDAGNLVPLAVIGPERNAALPNVPTIAEAGYPQFLDGSEWLTWQAIFAPAGTPEDVLNTLNRYLQEVLQLEEFQASLAQFNQDSMGESTPATAQEYLAKDVAAFQQLVQDLAITVE